MWLEQAVTRVAAEEEMEPNNELLKQWFFFRQSLLAHLYGGNNQARLSHDTYRTLGWLDGWSTCFVLQPTKCYNSIHYSLSVMLSNVCSCFCIVRSWLSKHWQAHKFSYLQCAGRIQLIGLSATLVSCVMFAINGGVARTPAECFIEVITAAMLLYLSIYRGTFTHLSIAE